MDVSIAVSLIRGQMGAVVERAVNGAVETVLAEMLKVVGVKFEELKAQVALMKQDVAALQREKALKEKENDNIRAKLRYTELKLKYYRQGVEEELQQRASASAIVHIDPSNFHKGSASVCPNEKTLPCTTETRTPEGQLMRSVQEPQRMSRCAVGSQRDSDADVASSKASVLLLVSNEPVDSSGSTVLLYPGEKEDTAQRKEEDQDRDVHEWTATSQLHTDVASPPPQALAVDPWQQPVLGLLPPGCSPTADGSTCSAPQVKQEADEVICIKEEPEDEHEFMVTLPDCQIQQPHLSESQAHSSLPGYSEHTPSQRISTATFGSPKPGTYVTPEPTSSLMSMAPNITAHQAARPWTKELTLYEEYRKRRNELRRRNLNRRREFEKTLPQPLLADMLRERREKTRLRVARWRAKRKLQACLNQAQALGGAVELNPSGFQPPRVSCVATSTKQSPAGSSAFLSTMATANSSPASLPFLPSASSSLLCRGPNMPPHQP